MNWIQTTQALLQLAPSILQLIVAIETLFPHQNGATKKAIAMSAVSDAHPELQAATSKYIDTSVKQMNDAGVFTTTQAAPAA